MVFMAIEIVELGKLIVQLNFFMEFLGALCVCC